MKIESDIEINDEIFIGHNKHTVTRIDIEIYQNSFNSISTYFKYTLFDKADNVTRDAFRNKKEYKLYLNDILEEIGE